MAILLTVAFVIVLWPVSAEDNTQITIITSPGCTKCAAAERVLTEILADYENTSVEDVIFSSEEGHRIIKEHKAKDVPSIIIGNSVIGYRDYDGNETELKMLIMSALQGQNVVSKNEDESDGILDGEHALQNLNLLPQQQSFVAGLLAGFNPCLLPYWAFLASTVLASSGSRGIS
jgi:glutaredoxin